MMGDSKAGQTVVVKDVMTADQMVVTTELLSVVKAEMTAVMTNQALLMAKTTDLLTSQVPEKVQQKALHLWMVQLEDVRFMIEDEER